MDLARHRSGPRPGRRQWKPWDSDLKDIFDHDDDAMIMLMKFYDDEEEDNFYLCGIEVEILLGYLCLQAKKPLHPQDKSRKLFFTKI